MSNNFQLNLTFLNTICGTVVGVYAAKKLIDYINYNREPKYKCLSLKNEKFECDLSTKSSWSYLSFFIEFLNEAKSSLDICFFLITDSKVIMAIIEAKRRNVEVRIITDYNQGIVDNHSVRYLFKEGKGIKIYYDMCDKGKTLMHHKFCIRDRKTLLQCSVNLTENSSIGSYDNVLITDDIEFVIPFETHFQELVDLLK